jgi:hypothetical protein
MLEWRPRLIALLAVVVVIVTLGLGFVWGPIGLNWEW